MDRFNLDEWLRLANLIDSQVDAACKRRSGPNSETHVTFSAYQGNYPELDKLGKVPIKGRVRFVRKFDGWGNGRDYRSRVYKSPTWLQIATLANDMIVATDDLHHVFLEGVEVIGKSGGITECEFVMGS